MKNKRAKKKRSVQIAFDPKFVSKWERRFGEAPSSEIALTIYKAWLMRRKYFWEHRRRSERSIWKLATQAVALSKAKTAKELFYAAKSVGLG